MLKYIRASGCFGRLFAKLGGDEACILNLPVYSIACVRKEKHHLYHCSERHYGGVSRF